MPLPKLIVPPGTENITCKGVPYAISPARTIQPINDEHFEMLTVGLGLVIAEGEPPAPVVEAAAEPDFEVEAEP